VYPVKVSANGRYFVDQKATPVFWLGTTQWQLFREYSLEDARTIIEKSRVRKFSFHLNLYSGQELRDKMESAGFSHVKLYGSLEGDPYGPQAKRLIAVGRKPKGGVSRI
jgi:hypothetical protein